MASQKPDGLGRAALVLGGLALVLFWIMVMPFESFAGGEAILDPLQLAAQAVHLACCPPLAIGLATFGRARMGPGVLSDAAVSVTIVGVFGFFGDAVIGAVVNPELARAAPATIAADGAMFAGLVLTYYVATFALLMAGMLACAWSLWRSGERVVAVALAIGAVLMNLPPMPGLHLAQVAGGVAAGGALAALGIRGGNGGRGRDDPRP